MSQNELTLGLFTDLYELTMAQAYWHSTTTGRATFSLFFRKYMPDRAYMVFAGLEDCLDYLEDLSFSGHDIAYLRSTNIFDGDFLDYLSQIRFTGDVRAMAEGTLFFANEPVIEVSGPMIEAQVVETFLLNQINVQSMLATKASRVIHAAQGKTLVDFAARRTHGTDAANKLARVAYMTGFAGTSNVMAGGMYGIPIVGTMAHSFVTAFENELEAFRAYGKSFPDSSTLLVDSYDTLEGVRKAIQVAREMRERGHALRAVRLDSGDLLDLSLKSRVLFDEAGFPDVQVIASGGLDEFEVDELLRAGAPIDGFGVGTKLGVSADAPWTDCVYKLVEYEGRPVLKLSAEKQTMPGPKQVYRVSDENDAFRHDVIAHADEPPPVHGEPLLKEAMRDGARADALPTLSKLRERFTHEFARLPDKHKKLKSPEMYEVAVSEELDRLTSEVAQQVKERELGASPQATN